MVRIAKEYKAKISFLNNKSRKGAYVYVSAKGVKGRYYRIKQDVPFDTYIEYFKDRYESRRKVKGTLKQYEQTFTNISPKVKVSPSLKRFVSRKYSKAIKARQTIPKSISKGVTSYTLVDALDKKEGDIRNSYKQCLKPLVLDPQLLDLLTLEENIQKLKQRFEYKASLLDSNGVLLGIERHAGKHSLRQVLEDLKKHMKKGMDIKDSYENQRWKMSLGKKGYSFESGSSGGNLDRVDVEIIFRY